MTNNNGVFRKKKVYFTQVSNIALRDTKLSLKAKGLYALIQSYITIEDFTLYKNHLSKQCKEGRDGFHSAWSELIKAGYLKQYRIRNDKGSFYYEYDLLDTPEPITENPHTENPYTGNPHTANPCIYKDTNQNNTNLNNTKSSSSNTNKKEEEDLTYKGLIDKCKELNIGLSLSEITKLMSLYDHIKVLRALEKTFNAAKKKKIPNGYNYVATIIENNMKQNVTNITVNKSSKNSFNNYVQREITEEEYNDIERKLLGWDD